MTALAAVRRSRRWDLTNDADYLYNCPDEDVIWVTTTEELQAELERRYPSKPYLTRLHVDDDGDVTVHETPVYDGTDREHFLELVKQYGEVTTPEDNESHWRDCDICDKDAFFEDDDYKYYCEEHAPANATPCFNKSIDLVPSRLEDYIVKNRLPYRMRDETCIYDKKAEQKRRLARRKRLAKELATRDDYRDAFNDIRLKAGGNLEGLNAACSYWEAVSSLARAVCYYNAAAGRNAHRALHVWHVLIKKLRRSKEKSFQRLKKYVSDFHLDWLEHETTGRLRKPQDVDSDYAESTEILLRKMTNFKPNGKESNGDGH